ncbi:MAG: hypothetical protein PHV77_02010 [Candidatus Omnitrophica bacterium]|nr:hypothetical protein [Candidatus Omnitrophota bacterium]
MDRWEKALKKTEIVRPRIQPLLTFATTEMPYIFLAESAVNIGDTVVRKGKVYAEKPAIILPGNMPYFEGFKFEEEMDTTESMVTNFLFIRGIRFPSYKYNNTVQSLDVMEASLKKAEDKFRQKLQKREDVHTGLIMGPEDCWQFSVLIYICNMAARSADRDIKNILDDIDRKRRSS